MEAAIEKSNLQMTIISMAIAFFPPGIGASASRGEAGGYSGRIQAGAGYVSSTDQLKKDADKRLDGLSTNADRFERGIPLVLLDLRYTFASGRQLYFGTPMESGGRPALSLGAVVPVKDGGKLDMPAWMPWCTRSHRGAGRARRTIRIMERLHCRIRSMQYGD